MDRICHDVGRACLAVRPESPSPGVANVKGLVVNIAVSAIAFVILLNVLPQTMVSFEGETPQLIILAIAVGVVNALIKPVIKVLTFPISLLTLGLSGLVVNAALVLVVAWAAQNMAKIDLTVGGFPTDGVTADTILAAVVVAVAMSVVTTIIGLIVHD
jgi:putative membrane protein